MFFPLQIFENTRWMLWVGGFVADVGVGTHQSVSRV